MKGRALAAVSRAGLGFASLSPGARRMTLHGVGFVGVAAGGAATGYLAAGSARGAAIGALTHVALFALVGAFFGVGRLNSPERVAYGVLGLGAALGCGYLLRRR